MESRKLNLSEFFENREIFVTGGSGVVGKALIEKLLRSCNVRKIYLLLRPKGKCGIEERLEQLKKSMIFRQLKLKKPDELNKKITIIPGDAVRHMLGITPEYHEILENVSIVFHCAATVRFDECLRDAIKLNIGGTLEAIKFAKTLKHLEVFMHVSTFYSNPYLKFVEEKVYEPPMDWKLCLDLVENNQISDAQLDAITRKLIVGFPNTYCFTKQLAESLVNGNRDKLPIAIYRPSIVIFALEEPEPGFSPTLMGALGLFAVTGAGLMKVIYMPKDCRLDLTPQDAGIKALCYYTYKTAEINKKDEKPKELPIYTSSSCTHCDITFPQYIDIMQDHGLWDNAAFQKNFLIPGLRATGSKSLYLFLLFFKQLLPAMLADVVIYLCGQKPALLSANRRIHAITEIFKPFIFNNYDSAGSTHCDEMLERLSGTEFNIDIVPFMKSFYKNVEICEPVPFSVREHLLKEDPKTLPTSIRILKIKRFVYKIMKFLLAFAIYKKVIYFIRNGYFE